MTRIGTVCSHKPGKIDNRLTSRNTTSGRKINPGKGRETGELSRFRVRGSLSEEVTSEQKPQPQVKWTRRTHQRSGQSRGPANAKVHEKCAGG